MSKVKDMVSKAKAEEIPAEPKTEEPKPEEKPLDLNKAPNMLAHEGPNIFGSVKP
jgi:hypothetical protein